MGEPDLDVPAEEPPEPPWARDVFWPEPEPEPDACRAPVPEPEREAGRPEPGGAVR
ncbi:hypothetical protein ACFY4C_34590 [Actinomadura viridis]|uniref:hypothetical protein n=1 Tax=Actinomadura viridis TaxID=58110 RepID=UPI0036A1E8B6